MNLTPLSEEVGSNQRTNETDPFSHAAAEAVGDDRFRQQIEALVRRSMEVRPRGRPKSETKNEPDPFLRASFRQLFQAALASDDTADLRQHTQQQKPWGSDRFRQQVEALTHRAAGVRPRGRPKSADK